MQHPTHLRSLEIQTAPQNQTSVGSINQLQVEAIYIIHAICWLVILKPNTLNPFNNPGKLLQPKLLIPRIFKPMILQPKNLGKLKVWPIFAVFGRLFVSRIPWMTSVRPESACCCGALPKAVGDGPFAPGMRFQGHHLKTGYGRLSYFGRSITWGFRGFIMIHSCMTIRLWLYYCGSSTLWFIHLLERCPTIA